MTTPRINPAAIDLIARYFNSHKKGLPELLKNAREAYLGANENNRHIVINYMRDTEPKYLECVDFVGISGSEIEKRWVYPGFPTLFWGLSVFFVGDLMGKALWKLVENAARFPRRGGRVLCVHGAVSFHRARPCGPRWLPGRGAMRHVELDRRVLGLQSTGE